MLFVKLRNWWKTAPAEPRRPALRRLLAAARFREHLQAERNRADRTGQPFALVVFRFEDEEGTERFRLAGRLEQRLRTVDQAGWLDEERIGVILANTRDAGARTFADKIAGRIAHPSYATEGGGEPIACRYEVYVYPGCGSTDPGHRPGRRAGSGDADGAATDGTATHGRGPATRAAIEQRLAETVELMQELVADRDVPVVSVQPLEPLFARPLPRWKRGVDILGAVVALVLFAPVMLAAAVLVKLTSAGPVIFRQTRVGLGGRPFTMYKFRTMYVDAEARQAELRKFSEQDGPAFKMANDPRITPVGRYLRKACIDEMPQLWNVLKGEMTLVGPRPLDPFETGQITGWQRRRIDVTPGLTCIWQIDGKSRVSFAEWMRMDIRYAAARSLFRDLRLIARTVLTVLLHRGSG